MTSSKREQSISDRQEKQKRLLIEELEKNPVIQIACQRIGIGRATYYRWRQEDAKFTKEADKALLEGNNLISDMAISKLITAIKEQNLGAIKFWLMNHHPDYANKMHITGHIKQEHEELSAEEKALVRKAMKLVSWNKHKSRSKKNKKLNVPDKS